MCICHHVMSKILRCLNRSTTGSYYCLSIGGSTMFRKLVWGGERGLRWGGGERGSGGGKGVQVGERGSGGGKGVQVGGGRKGVQVGGGGERGWEEVVGWGGGRERGSIIVYGLGMNLHYFNLFMIW